MRNCLFLRKRLIQHRLFKDEKQFLRSSSPKASFNMLGGAFYHCFAH